MQGMGNEFRLLEDSYSQNVRSRRIAAGAGVLAEATRERQGGELLSSNYPDIFGELQKILEVSSLVS